MSSIRSIGGAAGAEFPPMDETDSVERQIVLAARPALDAWHDRGLEGTVMLGPNEAPARLDVGTQRGTCETVRRDPVDRIGPRLGLRDRDRATVNASDALADYVLGLARQIIAPRGRGNIGFDQPVPVSDDVSLLDRLIAFTGRQPVS